MFNNDIVYQIYQARDKRELTKIAKGKDLTDLLVNTIGLEKEAAMIWIRRFSRRWNNADSSREKFSRDNETWLLSEFEIEKKKEVDEGGK